MLPRVTLEPVKREDLQRMADWLTDRDVNSSWYGLDDNGKPLHIGYDPGDLLEAPDEQLDETFNNDDRKFYSIYSPESEHIGRVSWLSNGPSKKPSSSSSSAARTCGTTTTVPRPS